MVNLVYCIGAGVLLGKKMVFCGYCLWLFSFDFCVLLWCLVVFTLSLLGGLFVLRLFGLCLLLVCGFVFVYICLF